MDAIGISRYLPVLIYIKGEPDKTIYVGSCLEIWDNHPGRFWMPVVEMTSGSADNAVSYAVALLKKHGMEIKRIGVESSFLPVDAWQVVKDAFPTAKIVNAYFPLERLRAIKTPEELDKLRSASERVVEAMCETFKACVPGMTKYQIVSKLREEEVKRDLAFEYCLITAGASHNRAPSSQALEANDIISLDSGGNYRGYLGDLTRMGILGAPDSELEDLLGAVDEIQLGVRKSVRPGVRSGDLFDLAKKLADQSSHGDKLSLLIHGIGMVSLEAPRIMENLVIPVPAYDIDRPLEESMAISIETTLSHPTRGFIKLEDTVAITATGAESYGDGARGWNRAGSV
jgi:Xaa-Pro aminopeptidase